MNNIHYCANIHRFHEFLHKKSTPNLVFGAGFMCFVQFYALFFSKAAKENAANAIILTITIAAPDGSSNA